MAADEKTMLLINREEALERIGGDESFLQELLGIYAEEFEKNMLSWKRLSVRRILRP